MILEIYAKVGDFLDGETVQGETSGATGKAITLSHLLCCDEVNPIDVVSPYFSAIFLPLPSEGLMLEDVEGTFADDEKITGQTSGTYAWTYEDHIHYDTYSNIQQDPDLIKKYGWAEIEDSCVEAQADFFDNPKYWIHGWDPYNYGSACYVCGVAWDEQIMGRDGYVAHGTKFYFKFDTTSAEANPTSAKIIIKVLTFSKGDGANNPTLRVYRQDYSDTLTQNDYGGGILESGQIISGTGEVELTVNISRVNIGGISKYKLSLKETDEEGADFMWDLLLGPAKLKLGYYE